MIFSKRIPKLTTTGKIINAYNRIDLRVRKSRQDAAISMTENNNSLTSRREFLQNCSSKIWTLGISSCIPMVSCNKPDDKKIVIIGAGLAGLVCAYSLKKLGLKATLYEASGRNGGRILTHYNNLLLSNGVFPEFGADFIDSTHHDVLSLTNDFKLELHDLKQEQIETGYIETLFYFDNKRRTEKEIVTEFQKIHKKLKSDNISLQNDLMNHKFVELDNTPLEKYILDLDCSKWFKDLLIAAYTAEYGLDCSEQSTLNFLEMIGIDDSKQFKIFGESDERYRIKGGNSKLIQALVSDVNESNIYKDHELISIVDKKTRYNLNFSNGSSIDADYVVIAIPFTMLKKVKLDVREITNVKKECIDKLGYGNNTKLIIPFSGCPWRDPKNNSMGNLFHETIVNGWDGSYTKTKGNTNSVYVCYFGGKYSQYLDSISSRNVAQPSSHSWKTQIPEKDLNDQLKVLDCVFSGIRTNYQNNHVFVNWIDYPYTKGSYSCYKVGQKTTIGGHERVPIGNIFFAGEHCSKNFQGFMNGSAETGRMAAYDIYERIRS